MTKIKRSLNNQLLFEVDFLEGPNTVKFNAHKLYITKKGATNEMDLCVVKDTVIIFTEENISLINLDPKINEKLSEYGFKLVNLPVYPEYMEAPQPLLIDLSLIKEGLNKISDNEVTVEIQKEGDKYQWTVKTTLEGRFCNYSECYNTKRLIEEITDINSDLNPLGVKFINVDNLERENMKKSNTVDLNGMEDGEREFGNKKENFIVVHKVNHSLYNITITGNVYVEPIYAFTIDIYDQETLKEVNMDLKKYGYELLLDFEDNKMPFTELYNKMTSKISNYHNDISNRLEELESSDNEEITSTIIKIEGLLDDANILEENRHNLLRLHLEDIKEKTLKATTKSDKDIFIEKYLKPTQEEIDDTNSIINEILGYDQEDFINKLKGDFVDNKEIEQLLKKKILGKVIIL